MDSSSETDRISEKIVERRAQTFKEHGRIARTILLAHIGFLAIVIPVFTYLNSIDLLTGNEITNKTVLTDASILWIIVIGMCLQTAKQSRTKVAALNHLLDENDRERPLPLTKDFELDFATTWSRIKIIIVEIGSVLSITFLFFAIVFDRGIVAGTLITVFFIMFGWLAMWAIGDVLKWGRIIRQDEDSISREVKRRTDSLEKRITVRRNQLRGKLTADWLPWKDK